LSGKYMIIDASIYYNEANIADIRINELKDVVDKFVVVSGSTTFQGNENPNQFPSELLELADIDVYRLDIPQGSLGFDAEHWLRDQIKHIVRRDFSLNDIVIVSDGDEVVRPEIPTRLDNPTNLEVDQYYYNFNTFTRNHVCMFASPIKYLGNMYQMRYGYQLPIIETAGWEFSFFADAKGIREKIQNYSHSEINVPEYTDLDKIQYRIDNGIDIVDRPIAGKPTGPLPEWVVNNRERFKQYWREDA
jgi:hypothetical protein